jgi:EAL domain-containing protein (putative c-di-GMP-specific phosphodiesterase class I)
VFDSSMHVYARTRLQLEIDLQQAIEPPAGFLLYYQPIIQSSTHKISGFEALIRWPKENGQLCMPDVFIKIAEETDLIIPIDLWVIQRACEQFREWKMRFPDLDPFTMSVNLSAKHFLPDNQKQLLKLIDSIFSTIDGLENCLKLEITEGTIIEDPEGTINFLHQLKQRKVLLSIDDFGTGYSSLSYLHQFPVDTLKIDRRFVQQARDAQGNVGIIQTITTLGRQLGLTLVAEGVETEEQLNYVKSIHCQEVQGYFFSPPVPVAKATELLLKQQWQTLRDMN